MIVDVIQLREALKKVGMAVGNGKKSKYGNALPITNNVLLESENGTLLVKSTDLESAICATLPCDGAFSAVCVPFKVFNQFVSKGEGKVSLNVNGKVLTLDRPNIGTLNISVVNSAYFPAIPQPKSESAWNKLDGKEVSRLFKIVAAACPTEESRPVLTAICCRDGEIASADGFRLYNAKSDKFNFGLGKVFGDLSSSAYPVNKLLPKATALKVIQLFKGDVEVAWGEDKVFFKSSDCVLVSQLVQGTYPRYEELIPTSFSMKASFSVPLMIQRLQLMDVSDGSGITRLDFSDDKVCKLSNHGGDELPIYEMTLPYKRESGEGKIAVNYKYLLGAIKPFSMCSIELTNPSSPMKITGDIEGLTIIIMPMWVQW